MVDLFALPIPDWGVCCPRCGAVLAGLPEHRCGQCGAQFDMLDLIAVTRPIPDIGLKCQQCGYLLTGLMEDRCPECGQGFDLVQLLEGATGTADHFVKKRAPRFTGAERPLPDFGLACVECDAPLAGAEEDCCPTCGVKHHYCPACGAPFDLAAIVPNGDWVNISDFIPRRLTPMARTILYYEQIPYLTDNASLSDLYGSIRAQLRVPREFFFDMLHAFATAQARPSEADRPDWVCGSCGNTVPGNFELCWKCQASRAEGGVGDES